MESSLRKGQIVTWKDDRGFGFIQPSDGGQEIFLHISGLKNAARRPQIGDTIFYQLTTDDGGKVRACDARIVGAIAQTLSDSPRDRAPQRTASSSVWLEAALLAALPVLGSIHLALTAGSSVPLGVYCVMSLLTFKLYRDDKFRAEQGKWRVPEGNLLLFDLIGGWIGGFAAQRMFYHKISKPSYQLVFRSIVAIHIAFWFDSLLLGGALRQMILNLLLS